MQGVITIGLDLAKTVFQVHGVDGSGQVVFRRQLKRGQVLPFFEKQPSCLVGMEACATAHHWAREISALVDRITRLVPKRVVGRSTNSLIWWFDADGWDSSVSIEPLGHDVRLMPARYVKPYVKRNKNDAADAEAICEAVTRPTMRFVAIKSVDQQSLLMLHRTRKLFVRQRTSLINAMRAHLAEFGIVAGVGRNGVERLVRLIDDGCDDRVPPPARVCLAALWDQLEATKLKIQDLDRQIEAWHRSSELSQRLEKVPGIGPLIATAPTACPSPTTWNASAKPWRRC